MAPRSTDVEDQVQRSLREHGPAAALDVFSRAWGDEFLGYFVATLRHEDLGRDAYADFCEQLLLALPSFRFESSTRTYAYGIAWNLARRHRRRAAQRRRVIPSDGVDAAAPDRTETEAYRKTEVKDQFAALRRRLSHDEQTLLILRVDRALSWTEIAEVMGRPGPQGSAALRKRFERVVQKIRGWMLEDATSSSETD